MSPDFIIRIAIGIIALALLLATIRLLRGPTVADRVVAFDLLTLHVLGLIAGTAVLTQQWLFLDAAIVLALMTFLATLGFARYMERHAKYEARKADDPAQGSGEPAPPTPMGRTEERP